MKKQRGYFGIGVYHIKNELNIGTLWRSANIFGASFIYTIGKRYKAQSSDTMKTTKHIPIYHYVDFDDFYHHMPKDCRLVGVEIIENATDIINYIHPERSIYLLGAEDNGLPNEIINRCHDLIMIPGDYSLNVSVAGSIVIYDRLSKQNQ